MKNLSIVLVCVLTSFSLIAQKNVGFNIDFSYKTVDGLESQKINFTFSYYPEDKTFLIDSDEAETVSRHKVIGYAEGRKDGEMDKIFIEGGAVYMFKKGKGGFVNCTYENTLLGSNKIVYGDIRLKGKKTK